MDSSATTSDHDLLIRIRQILDSFIREVENRFARVSEEQASTCESLKGLERELRSVVQRESELCTRLAVLESMNQHLEQNLAEMKKTLNDRSDEKESIGLWIALASTIATVIGLIIGFFIPR